MKKILFFSALLGLGFFAMAQQPSVKPATMKDASKISGQTKVTFSSSSAPLKQDQKNDRIKVSQRHLVYGQDNVVKFSVDNIQDKQLIVKVVSENLCAFRKGEKFGEYIFTPRAKEGVVTVRVGHMDVLGAYQNLGNIELFIGNRERPANGNVRPEGDAVRANTEAQRNSDNPSDKKTVTNKRTTVTVEETTAQ